MVTELVAQAWQKSSSTPTAKRDVLLALPELLAVGVPDFGIPAMIFLLLGAFIVPGVLAVGVVGALAAMGWLWILAWGVRAGKLGRDHSFLLWGSKRKYG